MNSFTDFKHTVPTLGAGQATYQQCWYASYKSLYTYHRQPAAGIDGKLEGKSIGVQDAKDNGLEDKKYYDAGTALGMTMWSGELFKQDPSWYDVGLSDGCEAFVQELQKGPLWVSRFIKTGLYHITVATGFKWGSSGKGYIIHNNPYPGPSDAVEVNEILANVYVKHITSARGSVQAFRS
jgi:hypothetical protein